MKKILLLICLIPFCSFLNAQVGINTATPDSSAALDIQSPPGGSDNRGVLFPRMTSVQRTGIQNPATSLFVFDTDSMIFYYYDGARWLGLVPLEPEISSGFGQPKVSGSIVVESGKIVAPSMNTQSLTTDDISVTGFAQNALVPSGAIMMWSGDIGDIPSGWALCDGNYYYPNGNIYTPNPPLADPLFITYSPDLRGRFIVGFDPSSPQTPATAPTNGITTNYGWIGNKGGETGHTLIVTEMPAHNHTGTTGNDAPDHTHGFYAAYNTAYIGEGGTTATHSDNQSMGTGGASTRHQHPIPADGGNQIHENRPPYFVLAYIIKLK